MKMIDSTTDGLRVFKAKLLPFRLYLETAVCRLVIVDFFPIQHTERRKSSESLTFENGVFLGRRLFLLKTQTSDRQKKKKKKKKTTRIPAGGLLNVAQKNLRWFLTSWKGMRCALLLYTCFLSQEEISLSIVVKTLGDPWRTTPIA